MQKVFNRRSLQFKLSLLVLRWGAQVSLLSRVRPRCLTVEEDKEMDNVNIPLDIVRHLMKQWPIAQVLSSEKISPVTSTKSHARVEFV